MYLELDMCNLNLELGSRRLRQELGKHNYHYWVRGKSRVYSDLDKNNLSQVSDSHNLVKGKHSQSQELDKHSLWLFLVLGRHKGCHMKG